MPVKRAKQMSVSRKTVDALLRELKDREAEPTVNFSVRMPQSMKGRITKLANDHGLTGNQMINALLILIVDEYERGGH